MPCTVIWIAVSRPLGLVRVGSGFMGRRRNREWNRRCNFRHWKLEDETGKLVRHPYVVTRGGAEASHRGVQAACTWEPRGYEEACRG